MASTRLTNGMREGICGKVIRHRFGEEEDQLEADEIRLGQLAYDELYAGDEKAAMQELPEGWLPEVESRTMSFAGQWSRVKFGKPLPLQYRHYDSTPKFGRDSPATELFEDIESRREKISEAKRAATAKVNGILSSATTVEKLLKIWPEVEPFIQPANTPISLPAIPRAEVNALLGLPTKHDEEE